MKLKASKTPYSSVVGGGVRLTDETGKAAFNIMICGTTNGINKEQDAALSEIIISAFNTPPSNTEDAAEALEWIKEIAENYKQRGFSYCQHIETIRQALQNQQRRG